MVGFINTSMRPSGHGDPIPGVPGTLPAPATTLQANGGFALRDRLFHALGRIVESLSTPDEMAAYLSQLGRDHRKYRVEPGMYEVVGVGPSLP